MFFLCPICDVNSGSSGGPCRQCVEGMKFAPPESNAIFLYKGKVARMIRLLKFGNGRGILPWLSLQVEDFLYLDHPAKNKLDVVVPVPASVRNRRTRGYDQSGLLAKAVARRMKLPCGRLFERGRDNPQTSRSFAKRIEGPNLFLKSRAIEDLTGKTVLLLDDVITTGTSMHLASEMLLAAGANKVIPLALAYVPLHSLGSSVSCASQRRGGG